MKGLSIAGTAAMFLVGGGILTHGIPGLHHGIELLFADLGAALLSVISPALDAVVGILAGALTLAGVSLVKRLRSKPGHIGT